MNEPLKPTTWGTDVYKQVKYAPYPPEEPHAPDNMIDGPYNVLSPDGNHKLSYTKFNTYRADAKTRVDYVGEVLELKSVLQLKKDTAAVRGTIFSVVYNYMPDGTVERSIQMERINEDRREDATFKSVGYDSDGNLHTSSGYGTWPEYRELARGAGHYSEQQLPQRIDFDATVRAFQEQVGGEDVASISFTQPALIPAEK